MFRRVEIPKVEIERNVGALVVIARSSNSITAK